MYYSFKEAVNAYIYDSEALYYGNLCGFEISGKPFIKACIVFKIGEYIPDIDELRRRLRDKGLEVPEDISLEELVITARSEGIDIPTKVVDRVVEMVKGYIGLEDVALIDIVYRKDLGRNWRIAVVVLNKPREAVYRGLPTPFNEPSYDLLNKVYRKLVVSYRDGVIGYVDDVVFSSHGVGLRVSCINYRSGSILWNNYLALLQTRGETSLANILRENIGSSERIDLGMYGYIYSLLEKHNAPDNAYEMLNNSIEFEEEFVEKYRDVGWSDVLKIGDVILVK